MFLPEVRVYTSLQEAPVCRREVITQSEHDCYTDSCPDSHSDSFLGFYFYHLIAVSLLFNLYRLDLVRL